MGMMARMRSLTPVFILTVGGLFVLFMVLSDSQLTSFMSRKANIVGSIGEYEVTYQEFSNVVERARENRVQQTGQEIPSEQMDQFRDQVWESLVTQKLIEQKVNELGISVSNEEIENKILGPNPPDFLKQNFIDSTGNFNRELYEQAILDPNNNEILIQVEETVRQQLLNQKLQDYLFGSITISEGELKRNFEEQNFKLNADYAFLNYSNFPDSIFEVTEDQLKEYYENHLDEFKIEAQRKLKYVLFKTEPALDDSVATRNDLLAITKELKQDTASFKTYTEIYSDQPYSVDTLSATGISPVEFRMLSDAKAGDITNPILTRNGFVVYKLRDKIEGGETYVKASHILITSDDKSDDEAKAEAMDVYNRLKNGADFAKLAKEYSADPGSASRGGDLGWFGKGQMVEPFEKAAFAGKVGVVQEPVKTRFGYHIIKTTEKSNQQFVVEKIVNKIDASGTTLDRVYNNANDFAYLSDKNDFTSEAELMKYNVMETIFFEESTPAIPGLGANKALIKFAFENSVGTVSDIFKVPAGYVVAMVSEVQKPGFKPLEEVEKTVKLQVIKELKKEKASEMMAEIKNKVVEAENINAAEQENPKVNVDTVTDLDFNGVIPNIGRDYAFNEVAFNAEINKITDPFTTDRGSYIVKVTERTKFDSTAYSIQRNSLRDNLLQQKKSTFYNTWIENIKKDADIEDERYKFYR